MKHGLNYGMINGTKSVYTLKDTVENSITLAISRK